MRKVVPFVEVGAERRQRILLDLHCVYCTEYIQNLKLSEP